MYAIPRCGCAIIEDVLTAFGASAVTFMMLMYALERRHRRFVLGRDRVARWRR